MRLKYEPASEPLHISVKWRRAVAGSGDESPPPLGSLKVPRHTATVGSYVGSVSCERGAPVSVRWALNIGWPWVADTRPSN